LLTLNGAPFTTGCARYLDRRAEGAEREAKIHVRFRLAGLEEAFLAALDTGAPWSCLDPELADAANIDRTLGEKQPLQTAYGRFEGMLVRVQISILAEEGDSLDVEGTFFVPSDEGWPTGRSFLGYGGLLERIRFAFDPRRNQFYFGEG